MSQSSESKSRILFEHAIDAADVLKAWATQSWKIGMMMLKGAYLLSERRRLFCKLGEEVYYKIEKGEFQNKDLEPLVRHLHRLTKKVELEERVIRSTRFGRKKRIENSEATDGAEGAS